MECRIGTFSGYTNFKIVMANTPSAAKRARQTTVRTLVNRRIESSVKNRLKFVREKIASGDKAAAVSAAQVFVSTLDKAVKTGNVHRNSASRHKTIVAKALAALK
jgi:small subunit ribosomal protein S20